MPRSSVSRAGSGKNEFSELVLIAEINFQSSHYYTDYNNNEIDILYRVRSIGNSYRFRNNSGTFRALIPCKFIHLRYPQPGYSAKTVFDGYDSERRQSFVAHN